MLISDEEEDVSADDSNSGVRRVKRAAASKVKKYIADAEDGDTAEEDAGK